MQDTELICQLFYLEYGYTDNKDIYNDADLVINNFSQLKDLFT